MVNLESHLAWGAWIEIENGKAILLPDEVAPRMGCVD